MKQDVVAYGELSPNMSVSLKYDWCRSIQVELYSGKWRFQFKSGNRISYVTVKSFIIIRPQNSRLVIAKLNHLIQVSIWEYLEQHIFFQPVTLNLLVGKGRNAYFAIVGMGSQTLNPLTVTSLYSKVVIPTVLYGCEMWNNLSKKDLCNLQIFQHFVVKHIQGMHRRTRSDMCETMLYLSRLIVVIEKRKLTFLQKLCQIKPNILSQQIFTFRLFQYLLTPDLKQLGFIPDIVGILQKYSRSSHLMNYIFTGHFPSKFAWKNIINNTINDFEDVAKLLRMDHDRDFDRFIELCKFGNPADIW